MGEELRKLGMKLGIITTRELRNGAKEFSFNFARCPRNRPDSVTTCTGSIAAAFRRPKCPPRYGNRVVPASPRQSRDQIWWEDLDYRDVDYVAVARWPGTRGFPAFYTVGWRWSPHPDHALRCGKPRAQSRVLKQVMSA